MAGAEAIEVDLPANATVGDLRASLPKLCPRIAGLVERSAIAVNNEYAADTTLLPAAAEVALVPPVSGG
ncbi:MAG: MoaD/ThiS family protein [Gemmataceae bacterium]|nr:MoaD/ThiS family protein [Gemmataceae bacterium]